jgi:hypothetical protein
MKTEFYGTKGKWRWNHRQGNRLAILENEYGQQICDFGDDYNYYPTEGTEPNYEDALLISKAPELLQNFISAIILLKQTTEFEVLDAYKVKVLEFEKLIEETLS